MWRVRDEKRVQIKSRDDLIHFQRLIHLILSHQHHLISSGRTFSCACAVTRSDKCEPSNQTLSFSDLLFHSHLLAEQMCCLFGRFLSQALDSHSSLLLHSAVTRPSTGRNTVKTQHVRPDAQRYTSVPASSEEDGVESRYGAAGPIASAAPASTGGQGGELLSMMRDFLAAQNKSE